MASELPRSAPCLRIASIAYSEQDGMNLQEGGSSGESVSLYSLSNAIRANFTVVLDLSLGANPLRRQPLCELFCRTRQGVQLF